MNSSGSTKGIFNRVKRKFLAIFISSLLVLSMFNVTAFADGATEGDSAGSQTTQEGGQLQGSQESSSAEQDSSDTSNQNEAEVTQPSEEGEALEPGTDASDAADTDTDDTDTANVATTSTEEGPANIITPASVSDIPTAGTKEISFTVLDETPIEGTILKPTGDTVQAQLVVGSTNLPGVIVALPKSPFVDIELKRSDLRISEGTVSSQTLIDDGFSVDPAYTDYYVLVFDRSNVVPDVPNTQFPIVNYSFKTGTTPAGSLQPIEVYAFDAVKDLNNPIFLGSSFAISATANMEKHPATSVVIKAEVEEITLGKAITSINDGGLSTMESGEPDTTLIDRPYNDTNGDDYTITYALNLDTNRGEDDTGRLGIVDDFLIFDRLDNFKSTGVPSSIKVLGTSGNTITEITNIPENTTGYEFSFKAELVGDETFKTIKDATYTVIVTYEKDDYTYTYPQAEGFVGAREVITNNAWMKYSTQDGASVSTAASPVSVKNAIGYKQESPDNITLKVQKNIQVKSGVYPYATNHEGIDYQAMYPEATDEDPSLSPAKVTFNLKQIGSEGEGETVAINDAGAVSFTGLEPGAEYTLTEVQGIENFTALTPKTVRVDWEEEKAVIKVDGVVVAGGIYEALNIAKLDGTLEVTVEKQDNNWLSTTLGDYSPAVDTVVGLFVDGSEAPIVQVKTNPQGKIKFENLDPSKSYTVKAMDPTIIATDYIGDLVPNEVTVTEFDANKSATAAIKYTSTHGALKIGKNFITAKGTAASTSSDLKASFRLVDKNSANILSLELKANGGAAASVYPLEIPAGEYELYEDSVSGATRGQYALGDQSKYIGDVSVVAGEFNAYNSVVTNNSSYGELRIKNFDYGSDGLVDTNFKYTVSYFDGGTTRYINAQGQQSDISVELSIPSGQSELSLSVPAGIAYTVTQTKTAPGFELMTSSTATATVAARTSAENVSVGGQAPNFTISGGKQAVGFVNASLPDASGTKVSVSNSNPGLSAAIFAVYKKDGTEYSYTGKDVTSNSSGKISLTDLVSGEYRLIEKTAPAGYALPAYALALASVVPGNLTSEQAQAAPKVVVTTGDYSTKAGVKSLPIDTTGTLNALADDTTKVPNAPLLIPKITMVDAADETVFVDGGTFKLYDSPDPNAAPLALAVSGANDGKFTFSGTVQGLSEGTYYIRQTALNEGEDASDYVSRPDAVVTIKVNEKGEIVVDESGFTGDVSHANSKVEASGIVFSNAKKPFVKIIKTGDTNVFKLINGQPTDERERKPITDARFTFAKQNEGTGEYQDLVIEGNEVTDKPGAATQLASMRGDVRVDGFDPDATYKITELSAPNIEGTDLPRAKEENIPEVSFVPVVVDGEIIGYEIDEEAETEAVGISNSTLLIHNPVAETYQIKVSKFGLGTEEGAGVYADGMVNVKFLVQKEGNDGEWVNVETIITGASALAASNIAISSDLTAGKYRLIEIQSGLHSPAIKEDGTGNKLYEYTGGGSGEPEPGEDASLEDWEAIDNGTVSVKTPEGVTCAGLLWGEITLGGSNGDSPDLIIGNDDNRPEGGPVDDPYITRLFGSKKAVDRNINEQGVTDDDIKGDIAGVVFEVYFGWATLENGEYKLMGTLSDKSSFKRLSNVVSGSVVEGKGNFFTEYVSFYGWDADNDPEDPLYAPSENALPCFVLKELGPTPSHIVKPTEDTDTTIFPFNYTSAETDYSTIDAGSVLPDDPEAASGTGVVVKNFEAEGILQINKYSLATDSLVDPPEGIYNVYRATGNTKGELQAVVDLSVNNEVELLRGSYFIEEMAAPDNYNLNGEYEFFSTGGTGAIGAFGGSTGTFVSGEAMGPFVVEAQDEELEGPEYAVLNVYDAPHAALTISNEWNNTIGASTSESSDYTLSYLRDRGTTGDYLDEFQAAHNLEGKDETLDFEVSGAEKEVINSLPDGVYLLKEETFDDDKNVDYHENSLVNGEGIEITIENGEVTSVLKEGSTGSAWEDVESGHDTANTNNPQSDNIILSADKTKITVNHLKKSTLAITMGYIDAGGAPVNDEGKIVSADFVIKGTDTNSSVKKSVTWEKGTANDPTVLSIPLDQGVYTVTQIGDAASSEEGTAYTHIDDVIAYVQIDYTGKVTYLQNNTTDFDLTSKSGNGENGNPVPLPGVPVTSAPTKYFYNKINAGKLEITKVDANDTDKTLPGAVFEVTNETLAVDHEITTGTNGTYTLQSLPATQGAGTSYDIQETNAPEGYYEDASVYSVTVLPNQTTSVTVENVPYTSITIHKDAQTPTEYDNAGNPVDYGVHVVEGLTVNLYKQVGEGEELVTHETNKTNANGNITFTGLDVGKYRIEEPSTVDVDGSPNPNLSYLDFSSEEGDAKFYNEENESYHFEVTYTDRVNNAGNKVLATLNPALEESLNYEPSENESTGTFTILNEYHDDSLFIPVKKLGIGEEGERVEVEGAKFVLADAEGKALHIADGAGVMSAKTNSQGMAYFHFMMAELFYPDETSRPYNGPIYVKEVYATEGYVISPYERDYLKLAVFEDAEDKEADLIEFVNEAYFAEPTLALTKTPVEMPATPLTQKGFDAEYTITPGFVNGEANKLPLSDYVVSDKGFAFEDAEGDGEPNTGDEIIDDRLSYTVTEVVVAQTTSGVENQAIYASIDEGVTWELVSDTNGATFTSLGESGEGLEGTPTNPTTGLFEIWYGSGSNAENVERVVGKDFAPGIITVSVSFDQFKMSKEDPDLKPNVATIINIAQVDALYPTSGSGTSTGEEVALVALAYAEDEATLAFPALPTMSITKTRVSEPITVQREHEVIYRITLTNDSEVPEGEDSAKWNIVNPTIIDHPEPTTYGGNSTFSVRVKVVDGKPDLQRVNFAGEERDLGIWNNYRSFVWDEGETAAWVFADSLAPGKSLSIEFAVTIDSVVMGDSITNTAYGTSMVDYDDLRVAADFYSEDNEGGALFKPTTAEQQAASTDYNLINGITGLNGGIYLKASASDPLVSSEDFAIMKQIARASEDESTENLQWSDYIEIEPGEDYYYRLQVQRTGPEGVVGIKDINIYEALPSTLGTTWDSDLISLLQVDGIKVEGHDQGGTYRTFVEGEDYTVSYFSDESYATIVDKEGEDADAIATTFNSFRVETVPGFVLLPKHSISIVYRVSVPEVTSPETSDETEFSYEELDNNARTDGISNFGTKYTLNNSSSFTPREPIQSNRVTAHLLAPLTDLVGTVWDDQNRNGILEDEAVQPDRAYTLDTLAEEDVTVVLYKAVFNSEAETYDPFEEVGRTGIDADGNYSFTELESSYGEGGPLYRVEFIYGQSDAQGYARSLTNQFSPASAFEPDGSNANRSHALATAVAEGSTEIVGETDSDDTENRIRLLHGTITEENASVINAGINALPYTVSYTYVGAVPPGAPAVPASASYITGESVTVAGVPVLAGYTFTGWLVGSGSASISGNSFTMPAENVGLIGTWVANGATLYEVQYYFQTFVGGGVYARGVGAAAGYFGTGLTDSGVYALVPAFAGYAFNGAVAGTLLYDTIRGDGSTILYVYYDLVPAPVPVPGPGPDPGIVIETEIGDDGTPLGGGGEGATDGGTTIEGDETPLASGIWCWVHWYIILGIILTLIYASLVVIRRRKFTNELRDFEDEILGKKDEEQTQYGGHLSGTPATQGMGA